VVVRLQQAAQRHLSLIADDRFRAAPHRLGRAAAFVMSRRHPAVDRGTANHERLCYHVGWLTGFNRHQHALA
jgi:hypothetical protein